MSMRFPTNEVFEYTPREELVNVITHALGALFGMFVLWRLSGLADTAVEYAALTTYGSSMILLFLSSVTYHYSRSIVWKPRFRTFDHLCIYIVIGGTYTPFVLLSFKAWWNHWFLAAVWGLVIFGSLYQVLAKKRNPWISLSSYIGLGFFCFVAWEPMLTQLPQGSFALILKGGVAYLIGVGFYLWDSLPHNHGIWHCFVLIGTYLHFLAIQSLF